MRRKGTISALETLRDALYKSTIGLLLGYYYYTNPPGDIDL